MSGRSVLKRIDWLTVLIYFLLVIIGWVNIYSTTLVEENASIFAFGELYGKQMVFIGISMAAALVVIAGPGQRGGPRPR